MAKLNQKLEQKLLQKLSPQQIQLIKLLEVPVVELEQRIKKEIEENPALEEGITEDTVKNDEEQDYQDENTDNDDEFLNKEEELPVEDVYDDDEIPYYKLKSSNYAEETDGVHSFYSGGQTFQEFMYNQLGTIELKENERRIAEYIIGSIDESGYLRRDVDAIANDLLFLYNVSVSREEVAKVLERIQNEFEPPGVGARNIQECLILQIKRKLNENPGDEILNYALIILKELFDSFSKKHYDKIKAKLNIDDEILREVINEIVKLNPKPGNAYAPQSNKNIYQIVPDFILYIRDGEPYVELNSSNVPPLRVNKSYESMLNNFQSSKNLKKQEKDAATFVKKKVESAKWFIDAIQQRQNTLAKTMNAILEYQKEFFRTGDETKLKPMILKDIAERTGLDISTISRVANSKYIQTPYGIYPLKFFFSEGMENSEGEEVSTRKIKKILKEAIENEDKRKPLTDEKLAKLLQERGFKIARRTVAKYREQMGILVARLRKQL